jgi:hypothetical protein
MIRTSDIHFIRHDLNRLSYLLGTPSPSCAKKKEEKTKYKF